MATSQPPQANPIPAKLILVRSASCKKISARASGSIEYRVAYAPDKSEVYLSLSGNPGGGGYFSKEWIPSIRIAECFARISADQPVFATKQLRDLFIGRSANNPPFIAAVLRAEGLLSPAPENDVQHRISGNLDEWRKSVLKQKGTVFDTQPANESSPAADAIAEADHADHPQPD